MTPTVQPMPHYETGLREVGDGLFAYLQWDGGWGISNAGCVVADDGLVVIDSLLIPSMTRGFLGELRAISGAPVRQLVNTHAHIDHTGGNALVDAEEIVAHTRCRAEMEERVAALLPGQRAARRDWMPDDWYRELQETEPLLPTRTFEDELTLDAGATELRLMHWGPAHTTGDAMVYLPEAKVLFAGDLAFFYATPLCRADMANWVRILERINADLEVDLIVPGHGPIGGRAELDAQREYLDLMVTRTRACFDGGLTEAQANEAIDLGPWARWPEAERKELNISQLYRTFEAS